MPVFVPAKPITATETGGSHFVPAPGQEKKKPKPSVGGFFRNAENSVVGALEGAVVGPVMLGSALVKDTIDDVQILRGKKKKRTKSGAFTGGHSQVRTPTDFESSMSSNSALMMMDGGTGSEHIKQQQQQMMM
jgi:hypothetical protein